MSPADNGGPAFPDPQEDWRGEKGMSLRDYFATNAQTDEVQELSFRHLSRAAQEHMTGLKYPEKPLYKPNDPAQIAYQLAEFDFMCAVNAAIRYRLADAMLKERMK